MVPRTIVLSRISSVLMIMIVTMSLLSILPAFIYNDDRIVMQVSSPRDLLRGGGVVGANPGRVALVNRTPLEGWDSTIPLVDQRRDAETFHVSSLGSPRFFDNITNNLARGANLMTSISGCHIASWVYLVGNERLHRDCKGWRTDPQVRINMKEGSLPNIQPYDTIYVHSSMLTDFIDALLPRLKVPVVLLSGSYDNTRSNLMHRIKVQSLLDHPMIEHWFCQNIINTTGILNYPLPAKLDPMALGVEPFDKNPRGPNPVVLLRDTILRYAQGWPNKSIPVFEAYTSPFTNPNRLNIPRGTKLTLPDYLEQLAKSKFVLSPSGHKPDCFRHYEALALGAIPVTDLNAVTYSHLALGPVVFGTKDWWNLTEAKLLRRMNRTVTPQANRNLIFEEFWMEEMERRVGRPLRWFDIRSKKQALLKEMYMNYDEIQTIVDSAWTDYSNDSDEMMSKFAGERNAWKVKGWPMPYL
jgi:hypothetical protein